MEVFALLFGRDTLALLGMSQGLAQIALATGEAAAATATVLSLEANVSAAFVTTELGAISTSRSLAAEAWHGIGVTNVTDSFS